VGRTAAIAVPRTLFGVRPEERGLVAWSAAIFGLASASSALVAAGADAMFLTTVGPRWLGLAVAGSSALLAVVLAVVGAFADRLDRPRLLGGLALLSATVIAVLAATAALAPAAVGVIAMIGGKQLAAAVDLAFWVVIAERLDARQSARLYPVILAAGGIGAVLGASSVVVLAGIGGPTACLVGGGAILLGVGLLAPRLTALRRVVAPVVGGAWRTAGRAIDPTGEYPRPAGRAGGVPTPLIALRAIGDGAVAVRRNPLAAHLAIVVGLAGAFASLAYFALGATAAAAHAHPGELAGFLGVVRGVVQVLALAVQLAITPRLLAGLGTGRTLVLAPLLAAAAAVALVVDPVLAVAVIAQAQARILDGAIETPAEKLAQSLLPVEVRGRVAGFLDGAAKRSGALAGGLVAAVLIGRPLYAVTAVMAVAWLYAAWKLSRRLPALAVSAVSALPGSARAPGAEEAVDARAIGLLLRELEGPRPERAAAVLGRLHQRGKIDAVPALIRACDRMVGAAAGIFSISDRAYASDPDRLAQIRAAQDGGLGGTLGAALAPKPNPELEAVAAIAVRCAAQGGKVPTDDTIQRMLERALAGAATTPRDRELVVRLAGLCGIAPSLDEEARTRLAARDAALDLALEIAGRRATADADGILASAGEAARSPDAELRAAAVRELAVEVELRVARGPIAGTRVLADGAPGHWEGGGALAAARALARAVRRRRGDSASHAAALAAFTAVVDRARGERSQSPAAGGEAATARTPAWAELALLHADLLELVRDWLGGRADPLIASSATAQFAAVTAPLEPAEAAAALVLGGALLDGADAVDMADVRLLVGSLGDRDDEVRAAAEDAVIRVGALAVGELLTAIGYGKRAARDHAARLLGSLPVTRAELDSMIERELDALDKTCLQAGSLAGLGGGWVGRRLDERGREIAHTVLLLVAARERSHALSQAARAWRHALGPAARARALAIIDAALPRDLVERVVEPVDELPALERARRIGERTGLPPPGRDAAVRAELAGGDRLARALILDGLGAAGRAAHRDAISAAAKAATEMSVALLRRIASGDDADEDEDADVETRVETLIVLGKVPLLAHLTTRQLADVAERARWHEVAADAVVIAAGETVDTLWIVVDGELAAADGGKTWGREQTVDDLAVVAPATFPTEVRATRATRLVRLDRIDFEELLDDVPGLPAAVCRVLGSRAR
jgi:hypothetical protein